MVGFMLLLTGVYILQSPSNGEKKNNKKTAVQYLHSLGFTCLVVVYKSLRIIHLSLIGYALHNNGFVFFSF